MDALSVFTPATREWFERTFDGPTPAQEQGWPAIASGKHTLIQAPTGSGKTLAAFLYGIDRLNKARRKPRIVELAKILELPLEVVVPFSATEKPVTSARPRW